MSIAAANTVPNFLHRRSLTASELQRVSEACVIFEFEGLDDDMEPFWVYTVGGYLDGEPLQEGCTVKGDTIVISGMHSREEADEVAALGLADTLSALDGELSRYREAQKALDRLTSVGAVERLDQATKPLAEKNPDFVRDQVLIRPLIGDDLLLAAGTVDKAPEPPH